VATMRALDLQTLFSPFGQVSVHVCRWWCWKSHLVGERVGECDITECVH